MMPSVRSLLLIFCSMGFVATFTAPPMAIGFAIAIIVLLFFF